MAEYHIAENTGLNVDRRYYNMLDMEGFSLMLKDPSYCYKFYWLEALVRLVSEGRTEMTFGEIIDEMIVSAWYSVMEFHIHLSGYRAGEICDGLECSVLKLSEISGLTASSDSVEIRNAVKKYSGDKDIKKYRQQLTNMVPYRALAGFFRKGPSVTCWGNKSVMTEYIRNFDSTVEKLPYIPGESSGLDREVYVSDMWAEMIRDNTVVILGWIQHEKLKWLQINNPEVPGMVYKLARPDAGIRRLSRIRTLWQSVMSTKPVTDIYTGGIVDSTGFDIDHFVPWSFVMNDEVWNLMPVDPSVNSAKSNRLPKWEPFFARFADNQYVLYRAIKNDEDCARLFKLCYKDNLHSIWADSELYNSANTREMFINILDKNMKPLYDSARRQGYTEWEYGSASVL